MSIEKTWGELNDPQDNDLSSLLQSSTLPKLASHNPLVKIKKNLLNNMVAAVLICMLYVAVIFYFQIWQVQMAIGLVLIFSLWAVYTTFQQYKQLNTTVSPHSSVLVELKRHYQSITNWMNTQQRVALYIYPVSAAGGFMLGGVLGSGKPVEAFMHKPFVLITLLIAIIILVPACWYLARWMFNYSFGKHLKALKKNIDALEEEK
ncbi:MAG: hypothetical protein WAT20_07790 [Ferruginibacter sp.]|nr:hypothetical protein [Chitinophagaceae bacterium]